jgi:hemolysin activation/secretion protein
MPVGRLNKNSRTHHPRQSPLTMHTLLKGASLPRICCLLLGSAPFVVNAQPDAGALRQQIEQERTSTLPREALPAKPAEPAPLTAPEGTRVTVTSFRFAGNTLLSDERLAPAVAAYLGRPLGLDELRKAAAAVAAAYREAGWVVRAYLPQQDIRDGTVTIQIVEAVFGGAIIEGDPPLRLKSSTVLGMMDKAQARGEKLNAEAIDRALLLIDDLPGVAVTGNFRSGESEGETALALKLSDEPLARFEIGADNTGSRSTGAERLLANLSLNSPLGMGDLLSANYLHAKGTEYLRAAYGLPVGLHGWRVGINASALRYRLVAPEFAAMNGKGSSDSVGLEASYPVVRSRLRNLYLLINHDRKTFDNRANDATTTNYRLQSTTVGLSGNLFDKLGGGGANTASLFYSTGELDLDGSPNKAADAATARTHGRFGKWRYAVSRQQLLTADVTLFAALSGQWTRDNLDSSEKFYLGGAQGVRAYPASEAGGAIGQMFNLEARIRLPHGFTLTPFYDRGRVQVNARNDFVGAAAPNAIVLEGAGLALGWQAENGFAARLAWARRIGDNPNPTATGKDQDGSLVKDRLWASVMLPF